MMDLRQEMLAIVRALDAKGIPYALCGGLAMAAHGFPRATQDVDLLVPEQRMDDARAALRPLGYRRETGWLDFASGRVRMFRIVKLDADAGDFLAVDLLAASGDLAGVWEDRRQWQTRDGLLWVVSREGLIAMKRARSSKQDMADIEKLEGASDES